MTDTHPFIFAPDADNMFSLSLSWIDGGVGVDSSSSAFRAGSFNRSGFCDTRLLENVVTGELLVLRGLRRLAHDELIE